MTEENVVHHVDRLELSFSPKPWPFAIERRAEINAVFAQLQRDKPDLWNGRVLLLQDAQFADGVLRGAYLEADYASFAAWAKWGRPDVGIRDCFGAAAVIADDGAVLLGKMGAHTFNAGQIYFPSGTPDPDDIHDGMVDLEFSIRRELKEETGLDASEFTAEPGWSIVLEGLLIVAIKVLRSSQSAEALRARMLAHLASERQPELADIRIVRSPADFVPEIRHFVRVFLSHRFGSPVEAT